MPHRISKFVETDHFREALTELFEEAEIERKTGLSISEIEEWLIEDAPEFIKPNKAGEIDEQVIGAFVDETMHSMVATIMPEKMKAGKDAAAKAKADIESLIKPVTELFVKHYYASAQAG